jgi:TonB family protein
VNSLRVAVVIGAVACLLHPHCLTGQSISGRVVLDSTGTPAARAVVVMIGDSARIVAQTHADSSGVFAIITERPGAYRLGFFLGGKDALLSPSFVLDSGAYLEREYRLPGGPVALSEIWLPGEVTKTTITRPRNPMPTYPDGQARRGIRGIVRVLFVVNEKGDPEMQTAQVIGASDPAFVEPVLRTLKRSHFWPAERDGRTVAQLTQLTFDFGCPGDPELGNIIIRTYQGACPKR